MNQRRKMKIEWNIPEFPCFDFGETTFDIKNSIKKEINNFFLSHRKRNPNTKYYYLYNKKEIIKKLDPNKSILQIKDIEGDKIFLTNEMFNRKKELQLNVSVFENQSKYQTTKSNSNILINKEIIYPKKEIQNEDKNKKKKIFLILSLIFAIIILLCIILIVLFLTKRKKNEKISENEILYKYENLKANIIYKPGDIYLFKIEEETNVIIEGEKVATENQVNNFSEYKNFLLIIKEEHKEILENNLIKYYYTGIFSQINSTTYNGTHLMLGQSDENVTKILRGKNKDNLKSIEEINILDYSLKNGTQPFFLINFYRNGIIKNIYIPEGYNISNMLYMKSVLNLTIPRLSMDLFVDNIEEEYEKIINKSNQENNDNEDENLYFDETTDISRNLSEDDSYEQKIYSISDNNNDIGLIFDLMESNRINSSENESINQIKEMKYGNVETDLGVLTGSQINSSILYNINEETGKLESVQKIEKLSLSNQTYEEESDNDYEYNNNAIKYEDIVENMTIDYPKIESSSFLVNKISYINCSSMTNDSSLFEELKKYFNSFTYKLFDEKKYNDINLRMLEIKNNFIKENNLNKKDVSIEFILNETPRKLDQVNDLFFGMQNFINSKETYKYNMMGLNLNQKVYTSLEPSTGKIKNYIDVNFGKAKARINLPESQTNLNILIQNSNKLTYRLIELIIETNDNILNKSNEYIEPILDREKNTTNLLTDFDDFSNILREPLNNMYSEVKNFTSELFKELIDLIKNIHQNYTLILSNINRNKYEIFNEIREITKNEYINYVYNMTDILENFLNDTLDFLNNILTELDNINDFQIDVLYDIIDSINECKELFEQFNKKLFLSIEKGIINFRYNLEEYIENLIGELLYITDFLSINLNKNEIIIKAIDQKTRDELIILLKDFRNIVNIIVDLLINNIQMDYESEISIENKYSIKLKSKEKVTKFLKKINFESENLILEIKKNIDFINQYEMYSNNIDIIESIKNKSLSEFNFDIYNNCIKNILNINSDFYKNKKNEIFTNKKKLFNIVNEIKNKINDEISIINNHIIQSSDNYFKENLFIMHTNIYYFRKSFFNNEMKNLLNQFEILVNYTIKVLFKENIKYNFDLGNRYLNDELNFFYGERNNDHAYATSGFIGRVNIFLKTFEDYLALTQSNEFLSLIEKYFYKVRDDILGYIDQQIKSIDKYYFDTDLYKNNFYYIEQSSNEIYKISDNINNFYNNLNLDGKIKINAIELSTQTLMEYNSNLTEKFTNLYSNILSRGTGSPKGRSEDFEFWTRKLILFF